ncbi:hypothetical protein F3Y22_tig00111671pilonHSYRG00130 [Hibiscus syriacus]|uniref:Uncharacterized protein n=1 Tax=Hibiscus syriacus TaxID=106335 RepID=A0A6A2XHX6_HIBSY|nr:hypothetical protein F3Y22_tig00111671pilonHSYRG00130 [Hibiscus syriacus]
MAPNLVLLEASILALSSLGYRTVAPDLRGYGDTELPVDIQLRACTSSVTSLHSSTLSAWNKCSWWLMIGVPLLDGTWKIEAEIAHWNIKRAKEHHFQSKPGPPCLLKTMLLKLGIDSSMERYTSESAGEVHCGDLDSVYTTPGIKNMLRVVVSKEMCQCR